MCYKKRWLAKSVTENNNCSVGKAEAYKKTKEL
jgi:hypothetical protein